MLCPGDRIGALLHSDDHEVLFLGWGIYEGQHLRSDWREVAMNYLPLVRDHNRRAATLSVRDWQDEIRDLSSEDLPMIELRQQAREAYAQAQGRVSMDDEQILEELKQTPLLTSARLRLDDGQVVWGSECRFQAQAAMLAWLASRVEQGAVVRVVPPDLRKSNHLI